MKNSFFQKIVSVSTIFTLVFFYSAAGTFASLPKIAHAEQEQHDNNGQNNGDHNDDGHGDNGQNHDGNNDNHDGDHNGDGHGDNGNGNHHDGDNGDDNNDDGDNQNECPVVTTTIVSDGTNTITGGGNAVPTFVHANWTSIPDATWIWSSADVNPDNMGSDETVEFNKSFSVGGTITNATLSLAADNGYTFKINGTDVSSNSGEFNYGSVTGPIDVTADITAGANTIVSSVTNIANGSTDPHANPAGLLYKLTITAKDCGTPPPPATGNIHIMKYECPANTILNRNDNGVNGTAPQGCVPQLGATFGYTYDTNKTYPDATGPYPGLTDATPFTALAHTDANGVSQNTGMPVDGRYLIVETDGAGNQLPADQMLGMYCEFDGDTNPNNNDNQEVTYIHGEDNTANCVAYNKIKDTTPPLLQFGMCGAVVTQGMPTGEETNAATYDYAFNSDPLSGNAADHKWVQVFNNEGGRVVWDMGTPTNVAYLVPSIDHGPTPGESHEATLFGSNSPVGPWVAGTETTSDTEGPSTWISDNDTTLWVFGQSYRYISSTAGGSLVNDGDAEIDAICTPVLPVCNVDTNLIENGDFENPALVNPSWDIIPASNPVLKWLVDWVSPQTSGRLGLEIQNHVAGNPAQGAQHAELDGDHPVKIWQNIATVIGQTYTLDFKYSARPGRDAADNSIQVKVNDAQVGATLADDGTSLLDTLWGGQTRTFVATSTSTKVEFSDDGTDTSFGGYLDAVNLRCQPPAPHSHITVTKIVAGNENYHASDFPLFVDDTQVGSGVKTEFDPATYTIHETGNPNFVPTFSGACTPDENNETRINKIADWMAKKTALQAAIAADPSNPLNADREAMIVDIDAKITALEGALSATLTLGENEDANCTITNTYITPVTTPTIDVSAQKVVCDTESALPNWGAGGHTIDATTAANWVAQSDGLCHFASGWEFEWGNQDAPDGGAATVGHVNSYTTFGTTDVNGFTAVEISLEGVSEIHLREVLQDGYIPFTGQNTTQDVSAEFYCTGDALNYDNWDFIRNPQAGTSYYCVAFNAPKVETPTDVCPNVDGNQATVPEGMHLNSDNQCVNDVTPPVDVCPNIPDVQTVVPQGMHLGDGGCVNDIIVSTAQCSDQIDNDDDQLIDAEDPGCHTDGDVNNVDSYNPDGTDETDAVSSTGEGTSGSTTSGATGGTGTTGGSGGSGSGSGGGGGSGGGVVFPTSGSGTGSVLGASTSRVGQVLGDLTCGKYLNEFILKGRKNNPSEVKKLQSFLNDYFHMNLPVTGVYGPLTIAAVEKLQLSLGTDILSPWLIAKPTGHVYLTTQWWINNHVCETLKLPVPFPLVPIALSLNR